MRTPTVAVAAAVLLLATACGGEEAPTAPSSAASPTLTGMDDAEVARYLPGEGQMPGDWGQYDGEGAGDGEQATYPKTCSDLLVSGRAGEDLAADRTGSARRTYIPANAEDSAVGVKITSYRDGVPDDVFTAMGAALGKCSEYEQINKDGTTTYLAEGASGPSYGERTFRFRTQEKGTEKVFERVIFSVDGVLVQVLEMHPGGAEVRTGALETAARAAESNLRDGPPETGSTQQTSTSASSSS